MTLRLQTAQASHSASMNHDVEVESSLTPIRDVITRLQSPIPDLSTLLPLLCGPLSALKLLPQPFRNYNTNPLPEGGLNFSTHIPPLQRALLEHVIPAWESTLVEKKKTLLLTQYFCPESSIASPASVDIALLAYSSILSLPLTEYSINLLTRLSIEYPIDKLHAAIFSSRNTDSAQKQSVTWEDCLRNVAAVPAKVANVARGTTKIPPELEQRRYFDNLSLRCELLIFALSTASTQGKISLLTYLLTKLVNVGVFPSSSSTSPSQSSFWKSTLPTIRRRLHTEDQASYSYFFSDVIQSIPSALTQQAILGSLLSSLIELPTKLDPSPHQRALVKREASVLRRVVGPLDSQSQELWDNVSSVLLSREWDEGRGRVFICWTAGADSGAVDTKALEVLLSKTVEVWSSQEHVKHSLLTQHRYLTSLLLLTISYFPLSAPQVTSLAVSPTFISGIGHYIDHLDHSVRRCGMLVAEVVAHRADKKLNFGDWDGDDTGKLWARELRMLITARDVDADIDIGDETDDEKPAPSASEADSVSEEIVTDGARQHSDSVKIAPKPMPVGNADYDSDDSLTGYAPPSSRSTSPTPSELEEIERDPTLRVGVKKIPRPVYLAQLGELVRSTSGLKSDDSEQEADKIEMALNCGEELIRRKRGYGVELDENAVNLVYGFVGLQDNFDLENFDVKRQGILGALVSCCPRIAAPSMIDEFFKNQYSAGQRFAMLNALALAARELASLPTAPSVAPSPNQDRTYFPSKMLPTALHRKYLVEGNQSTDLVQHLLDGISREAIDRGKEANVDKVPNLVRERQLRIRKPAKISELHYGVNDSIMIPQTYQHKTTFTDVAAEFFIAPLINRFWLFLRNEQTREARTAHQEPLYRYKGSGTGLILNPMVLTHFLRTLAILVHAAQNAPQWLAIVAPDALELAVTLGAKPVSQVDDNDDDTSERQAHNGKGKEASLLTTALELILVVLDGCLDLDGGRSLGLEHTALLLGAGEWAGDVFSRLERGARVEGGGGAQEVKLKRAAAGVLLKVDELTSKWRRSMVDVS